MRQIRATAYGPPEVLVLEEVPVPQPKDNEVLIRMQASTMTAGDCELRRFQMAALFWLPLRLMFGIFRPRRLVLGQDFAGIVEKTGSKVTGLAPGDAVYGLTGMKFGGHADYVCLPGDYTIVPQPKNLTPAEAVSLAVGGYNALDFLKEAVVEPGEKVLIHGSGGTIGTMAVQVAKHMGAEVTAIDSADKLEVLKQIGADHVIDYRQQDFTQNGEQYDVIIDLVHRSPKALASLKEGGFYVLGNPSALQTLKGKRRLKASGKTIIPALAGYTPEKINFLTDLAEAGTLVPVVDRLYPLEDAADAHRYVESGQKVGNVVLVME